MHRLLSNPQLTPEFANANSARSLQELTNGRLKKLVKDFSYYPRQNLDLSPIQGTRYTRLSLKPQKSHSLKV